MNGNYSDLVAVSSTMVAVQKKIDMYAPLDTNILILGETGTGKELVARQIHAKSKRQKNRFEALNTGALPHELVESELFGYERGAFTGAEVRKAGYFELADYGTLFLDEIGNMPQETQVKLLRVLDEGVFRRIGDITDRQTNARIISATNNSDIYDAKNFRRDLLYRLAVAVIEIPSLRERKEDIDPIAAAFLKRWNEKNGSNKMLDQHCLSLLREYDYPGNVRELQNILERVCIESPGERLDTGVMRRLLQDQRRRISYGRDMGTKDTAPASYAEAKRKLALEYMRNIFESYEGNLLLAVERLRSTVPLDELAKDLGYGSLKEMLGAAHAIDTTVKKLVKKDKKAPYTREDMTRALRESNGDFKMAARSIGITPGGLDFRIKKLGYKGRADFRSHSLGPQ